MRKRKFREINFPKTYKYSSDSEHIPLEFYLETFPIAERIDLLLGYFSSNAFKLLAPVMAEFIHNGGKMRIITNHIYSLKDKQNLIDETRLENEDKVITTFKDIYKLKEALEDYGNHFFDCLRFLLNSKRLELIPVKFNGIDLAHCKKMILFDGVDTISTDGSINFTMNALTKNSESFEVNAPWEGEIFKLRTENEVQNFEKIVNKIHPSYEYITKDEIETVIYSLGQDKNKIDLISDSLKIQRNYLGEKVTQKLKQQNQRFNYIINKELGKPCFPFESGPRDYQVEAYNSWVNNSYSGIFAMATGTGKTITSLNCLLNLFQKSNSYKAIILVPSIALLNQWENEVKSFNFNNILKIGGGNNWEKELATYVSNFSWDIVEDLVIISTYGSFTTPRFQKYFKKIATDFMLIADEAHNMGANNIRSLFNEIKSVKKIGLSATPDRIYDQVGTNALNDFFNDEPPYTYNFDMEKALKEGFLTEYKYYPRIVELTEDEFEEYIKISKKLLKFFDFETGQFKNDPVVEKLLLQRKNIIHKAINKISCFKTILKELNKLDKLNYIFTYVPEGYIYYDNDQSERIIDRYILAGSSVFPNLKANTYTSDESDLKDLLRGFADGRIDLLYAMKMLDEGVDVPRAEVGIFCSSTGNPRQFIQRRGRLLRKHPDKTYATIYDMVVIPSLSTEYSEYFNMERNLVINEIRRVAHFASLSMNYYDTKRSLENVINKYNINLDEIINEL